MKPLAGRLPGPVLRIRLIGALLLVGLAALVGFGAPWTERLQGAWFDWHQALQPREPRSLPVTIVAIDQKSLVEIGQWPWPRSTLARLVETINAAGPAAIGINILMPEADALSPERLLAHARIDDPAAAAALRDLPSHDSLLARALSRAPVVLAVAGTTEPTQAPLRAAPVVVRSVDGTAPQEPAVPRYRGALTSIEELDAQAEGWGLTSVETRRGVIRRMPLVSGIDRTLLPTLGIEMLRVAQRAPGLRLTVSGDAVRTLAVGAVELPTEADGALRIHFAPHDDARFVSAVDVLGERIAAERFHDRLVLIGFTGLGLQDVVNTPIGERLSGTEIHAQLLENLVEGDWLIRPRWAPLLEASALLALGGLLLWTTPRWKPFPAALLMLGCVAVPVLVAYALFHWRGWLVDAASPGLSLLILFGLLLVLTLAEVTRQGRALQEQVQAQREQGARLAGELLAAQRVQMTTVPSPQILAGDRRLELQALLTPAREVGGDLYDFFMLDDRRLFLLVGDVAGKGLPASIFMAVSKALCKSAMLRAPDADIGAIVRVANAEVSRENSQMLFVTAFAAIVDLDTGRIDYCNAGHDNPYRLHPSYAEPQRLAEGDGPPLCAVPDYDYRGATATLQRGELLCVMTDGVTEAQNAAGELFGHERVERKMVALQRSGADAATVIRELHDEVQGFVAGAEAADDLTLLALRWFGPEGAEAGTMAEVAEAAAPAGGAA